MVACPAIEPTDFIQIQQLIGCYGYFLDECIHDGRPWETFTALFTDDAVFDMELLGHGTFVGSAAITAAMKIGIHPLGHHSTGLVIRSAARDRVESTIKLLVVLPDGRSCTGTYDDVLVRTGEGWKFARRRANIRILYKSVPLPDFAHR